jgi:hypothetical protein
MDMDAFDNDPQESHPVRPPARPRTSDSDAVIRIGRVEKWIIVTALSVICSAIGITWKASAWVTALEAHLTTIDTHLTTIDSQLKGHDEKFTELQRRQDDASRDTAARLAAIQATLDERGRDHKETPQTSRSDSDSSAKALADGIAEIGKRLNSIGSDGIPINLLKTPTINIEQKKPASTPQDISPSCDLSEITAELDGLDTQVLKVGDKRLEKKLRIAIMTQRLEVIDKQATCYLHKPHPQSSTQDNNK